jgi:hypothetical protein
MEKTTSIIPAWEHCQAAVLAGKASALERFIYDQEPAGVNLEASFRDGLLAVVLEVTGRKCSTCRPWRLANETRSLLPGLGSVSKCPVKSR